MPSEHRCGVQGFDAWKGDVCEGCSAEQRAPRLSYTHLKNANGDGDQIAWHDGTVIGVLYVIKHIAKRLGYAVAWHGSLARDLDLIAVPWTENAQPVDVLVDAIKEAIGGTYTSAQVNPALRPHGRLSFAMNLLGAANVYVDLSVFPPVPKEVPHAD